jgi:formamidopyrimidine-DNA glycosylase
VPELPELEVVREVLERKLRGARIRAVEVNPRGGPLVLRDLTGFGFGPGLLGAEILAIQRKAKFVIFHLGGLAPILAVNPKLTGRFQLCPREAKKAGPVQVAFRFDSLELELRYIDSKRMGQLYLLESLEALPGYEGLGPEALDVSLDSFRMRLCRYTGEIKGVLVRGGMVSGIGNAYADEILWHARIHPFRRRPSLSEEDIDRLYASMRTTLLEATEKVRARMGEAIHSKPRDFFAVHLRAGESCPRCGERISQISANQRITNFCRHCQPGGLIPGM